MTDNDMLVEMAKANWKGCRCGCQPKQAANSNKIPIPQGVNWQIPMMCPQCNLRHRLTILIPHGVTLKNMYDMWHAGKVTSPKVNIQPKPSSILTH